MLEPFWTSAAAKSLKDIADYMGFDVTEELLAFQIEKQYEEASMEFQNIAELEEFKKVCKEIINEKS